MSNLTHTSPCHPQVWAMGQCRTTEPIPTTGVGDGAMSHDRAHTSSIPTTGVGDGAISHDRAHNSSMPSTGVGNGSMLHDRAHTSPYHPQVWAMEQCRTTEPIPLLGPVIFRFKKSNFPFQKKGNSVSIPFHYCQNLI